MWHDATLKMYMDAAVQERLAEARRDYVVRRSLRLDRLRAALRRVQSEVDAAEAAIVPRAPSPAARA